MKIYVIVYKEVCCCSSSLVLRVLVVYWSLMPSIGHANDEYEFAPYEGRPGGFAPRDSVYASPGSYRVERYVLSLRRLGS